MSKEKEWVVEFDIDYEKRTFAVKRVIDVTESEYPRHNRYGHTFIGAADELGAFSSAVNRMEKLGFKSHRD